MTFIQRLKLYGAGFVLGMIILLYILGQKGCRSTNHMKVDELVSQYTIWSPKAQCQREALGLDKDTFYYKVMAGYRVNYSKSEVHKDPCGIYRLEPLKRDSARFDITICDCDTISKIDIIDVYPGIKLPCDSIN